MNFDFDTETITPDNTDILTIGGNGGLEIPVGPTSLRPVSPANGLIRYNTDTGTLEGYFSNQWTSTFSPVANQIIVQQNPGAGEFGSIAEACSFITEATITNPWEILIAPGTYVEPEILIPPYVQISGLEEYGIIVSAETPNQNVFVMSSGTSLNFLTVHDAGPGFAGVAIHNIDNDFVLCHKVGIYNCDIGFDINSSTADSVVYLEYCDTNGAGTAGTSVVSANGFSSQCSFSNVFSFGDNGVNPNFGMFFSGPHTLVDILSLAVVGVDLTGEGMHIEDGALVFVKAGYIIGWDIGALVSDSGAASNFSLLATSIGGNTSYDLRTLHPEARGSLNGEARGDFVDTSASPLFTLAYSDQTKNRYTQTGAFFLGPTGETVTDVSALIIDTPAVGLLLGGLMSSTGGTVVDVTEGSGYLRKDGLMTRINWDATSITLSPDTQPYLFIDHLGALQQSAAVPDYLTNIILGRVGVNATQIYSIGELSVDITNYGNKVEEYLRNTVGPIFVSGSVVSPNVATPRAFDVTAGRWYYGTQQRLPSSKVAPVMAIPYHVGGVLTSETTNLVPNTSYDNGTDLVPLTPGFYTKHVLYQSSDGVYQSYLLAYGQAEYETEEEAIGAPLPSPVIDPGPTPKIASFIMQEGVNSIPVILDERPVFGSKSGGTGTSGTNVHSNLLGLDADDHKQYLLIDGLRPMIGHLDMGTFDIVNAGTINGLDIDAHGARHAPNGVDSLPTASAVGLNASSVNSAGIANSYVRSDHTHQISGFQPFSQNLSNIAAISTTGIVVSTGATTWNTRTLTGTLNRISVTNGDGILANPTIDIDAAYIGQTSITTLGTIASGTWNASTIALNKGGTGQTTKVAAYNALTPITSVGDLVIGNGANSAIRLPIGTASQLLTSNGTTATWVTLVNGGLKLYAENSSIPAAPVAAGVNAIALGSGSSAPAANSLGIGAGSNPSLPGSVAIASGVTSVAGDAQNVTALLRNISTNAVPVELFLDGAAGTQRLVLPNNSVWTFDIKLSARRTDVAGTIGSWKFEGCIYKDATPISATIPAGGITKSILARVGGITSINDPVVSADTTNGSLKILVTGNNAQTIRWVASINLVQVTN